MARIPPEALEEVYAVPPADFTRTRNARATALAKAGHRDAAEALRRLRRPPAPLWAVNQLARLDPKRLDAFIDAVAQLRRTQIHDPRAVGDAMRQQRATLDALLETARAHLVEHGLAAGPETLRRMSNTLQGAAVEREHADALRRGRLTEELAAPGFEVFAGTTPARLKVLPGGKTSSKGAAEQQAAEHRAREEQARQQRAREAEERERLARERQAQAEAAAKEVDALSSKLAEARRRLSEARHGAKAAARKPRRTER